MSLFKRVAANSGWLFIGRVVAQAMALLITLIIARRWGDAALGQYTFITSIVFIGNISTTLGVDSLLIREIARSGTRKLPIVSAALIVQLVLSLIFTLMVWLFGASWSSSAEKWVALIIYTLSLFPLAFTTIYSAAWRGREQMGRYAIFLVASNGLQLLAILLLVGREPSIRTIAVALLGAQIAAAALAALFGRQAIRLTRPNSAALKRILRLGWVFGLLMLVTMLYRRFGIFWLTRTIGDAETGHFSAAFRVVEAGKLAPQALFGALFPLMARTKGKGVPLWATPLVMVGVAVVGSVSAEPIIQLLFDSKFTPAIPLLRILIWSLPPFAIVLSSSFHFIARNRERVVLLVMTGTFLITVPTHIALVTRYGTRGAAWATVIAEIVAASLFLIALKFTTGQSTRPAA